MKRLLVTSMLTLLAVLFTALPVYANNDIRITINGEEVVFDDQAPTIVGGRTLVPVRGVFEQLGFVVEWHNDTRQAELLRANDVILINIDSSTFITNGVSHTLDVPAQLIGGRTMLPLRAVLESVNYYLDWDGSAQTVLIYSTPFAAQTGTMRIDAPEHGRSDAEEFLYSMTSIFANFYFDWNTETFYDNNRNRITEAPWVVDGVRYATDFFLWDLDNSGIPEIFIHFGGNNQGGDGPTMLFRFIDGQYRNVFANVDIWGKNMVDSVPFVGDIPDSTRFYRDASGDLIMRTVGGHGTFTFIRYWHVTFNNALIASFEAIASYVGSPYGRNPAVWTIYLTGEEIYVPVIPFEETDTTPNRHMLGLNTPLIPIEPLNELRNELAASIFQMINN